MNVLIGPSSFGEPDPAPLRRLEQAGLTIVPNPWRRRYTKEEIIALLHGIDGLIAGLEPLDRDVLASAPSLKVVSRCGAGMSNVDQQAARELRIQVFNTPNGPTEAVAEMTLGCLLAVMRQAAAMSESLHAGRWDKRTGSQLQGKTVAIVGYGRIGRRVAELLTPFGIKKLIVDPQAASEGAMPLTEVLPQADVILLHLSGETCVLDAAAFARMKRGVFICNAARGGAVDEAALIEALNNGTVAGAWLDALPKEPYSGELCRFGQVLLTPHCASYTAEGRLNMEMECVENLIRGMGL